MKVRINLTALLLVGAVTCGGSGLERPPAPTGLATIPGFEDIVQVAVITPDTDAFIETARRSLGAGTFKVVEVGAPELFNASFRGQPADWSMRLGISWIGNMQLEVIQPKNGPSRFHEYLERRGGRAGIQHIFLQRGELSYADAVARMQAAGFAWQQEAQLNSSGRLGILPMPALPDFLAAEHAARFGYTDSFDGLKLDVELARFPPGVSQRLALRAADPLKWIPADDQDHFEAPLPDAPLKDLDALFVFARDLSALTRSYARLADREPRIETYSNEILGSGRLARLGFATSTLYLLEPAAGPGSELLASFGEGVGMLRGRPLKDLATTRAGLQARGWQLREAATPNGPVLAIHPEMPFALLVAAETEQGL